MNHRQEAAAVVGICLLSTTLPASADSEAETRESLTPSSTAQTVEPESQSNADVLNELSIPDGVVSIVGDRVVEGGTLRVVEEDGQRYLVIEEADRSTPERTKE